MTSTKTIESTKTTRKSHGSETSEVVGSSPIPESSRKRKREVDVTEEIEINVSAPEPPSKKALRKAKKGKLTGLPNLEKSAVSAVNSNSEPNQVKQEEPAKRSEYGIWIGNLPFTTTKAEIVKFLTNDTNIAEEMITRLNMPTPTDSNKSGSIQRKKPQNKGFAYVDLSSPEALKEALGRSEKLLMGRRVLIKDSKSFEGRPEKPKDGAAEESLSKLGKMPSNRIFVGNLGFDTTKEDLQEHFAPCGKVIDVHVATFEDSGKCKGYAWVEFETVDSGAAAMRGWVKLSTTGEGSSGTEDEKESEDKNGKALGEKRLNKVAKPRKWWVNRMKGRPLRMEFAEDKAVRYKKRFGKEGTTSKEPLGRDALATDVTHVENQSQVDDEARGRRPEAVERHIKPSSKRQASGKVDARTIKPGAALANAPRLTGAIVASKGTKKTFD